jgi:hypothetical protein
VEEWDHADVEGLGVKFWKKQVRNRKNMKIASKR